MLQDSLERLDPKDSPERRGQPARQEPLDHKAAQAARVQRAQLARLDLLVQQGRRETPEAQALLDQLDPLARAVEQARQERRDQLVLLDRLGRLALQGRDFQKAGHK